MSPKANYSVIVCCRAPCLFLWGLKCCSLQKTQAALAHHRCPLALRSFSGCFSLARLSPCPRDKPGALVEAFVLCWWTAAPRVLWALLSGALPLGSIRSWQRGMGTAGSCVLSCIIKEWKEGKMREKLRCFLASVIFQGSAYPGSALGQNQTQPKAVWFNTSPALVLLCWFKHLCFLGCSFLRAGRTDWSCVLEQNWLETWRCGACYRSRVGSPCDISYTWAEVPNVKFTSSHQKHGAGFMSSKPRKKLPLVLNVTGWEL